MEGMGRGVKHRMWPGRLNHSWGTGKEITYIEREGTLDDDEVELDQWGRDGIR